MNCNDTRLWLGAHLDGELDLSRDAEVLAHLEGCPGCAALRRNEAAWRETVREKLPRWSPPAQLETRIRAELHTAKGAPDASVRRWYWTAWIGGGAAAAVALAFGYGAGARHERAAQFADELVSAHVIAVARGQLAEVASADRHTVKPWLAAHLDFSPPVADFAGDGFPLIGGRVERLQGHAVAALIYQRHKHVITVYVAPGNSIAAPSPAGETRRGYHLRAWRQGDLDFAAVSDVAPEELDAFVGLLRTVK